MFGANLSTDTVQGGKVDAAFSVDGSYTLGADFPRNTALWGTSRSVQQEQRQNRIRGQREIRQIDQHTTTQERTP